ncbi:polysaccharide export outer membrane protein [Erythrobacter sp. HL-111]|nr:MAG: polysaccharide export outer membrane protein [Erythrobacteraceae bacterium HL-111]SDS72870.1 polysaccharide export outer membrane protein [Erythrobacter sp. HL-111]
MGKHRKRDAFGMTSKGVNFALAALALGGTVLSGCASGPGRLGGAEGLEVIEGALPPPTPEDIYAAAEFGGVGPFDKLKIDVFGIAELSDRLVRVDANGTIGFPLVGTVEVSGMTTSEISRLIETRLKGYVREPQVTTNLESSETRTFTVYGEVKQPGVFPVIGEASLMQAVATARGIAEYGNASDVIVFRTVAGKRMATLYNLDAISRGAYADPRIYPNDTVVVGDDKARRLFDDVVGVATILATPLTIVLTR